MFYNARHYDASLNRFVQPDSIIPDLYNPQDLNRYAYVKNNPVRFNDPTGNWRCDPYDPSCAENDEESREFSKMAFRVQLKQFQAENPLPTPFPFIPMPNPVKAFGTCDLEPDRYAEFWKQTGYRPSGWVAGLSGGGDLGALGATYGTEFFMTDATYPPSGGLTAYGGGGPALGSGVDVSPYLGVILNADENYKILGKYYSYQLNFSAGGIGVNITNVVPEGTGPLAPGVPQTLSIGYAPDARLSGGIYLIHAEPVPIYCSRGNACLR